MFPTLIKSMPAFLVSGHLPPDLSEGRLLPSCDFALLLGLTVLCIQPADVEKERVRDRREVSMGHVLKWHTSLPHIPLAQTQSLGSWEAWSLTGWQFASNTLRCWKKGRLFSNQILYLPQGILKFIVGTPNCRVKNPKQEREKRLKRQN